MLTAMVPTAEIASEVILTCKKQNLILFWLLFEPKAIRITPPLTISNDEIKAGCAIITDVLNSIQKKH